MFENKDNNNNNIEIKFNEYRYYKTKRSKNSWDCKRENSCYTIDAPVMTDYNYLLIAISSL